ncbi:MAG: flagellar biosynthetic protein FliR [Alphaproteobacteria bacterium]
MLEEFLVTEVFKYFLVFARVGAALSVMPGFAERYIQSRTKLAIALMFTVILTPVIQHKLPVIPENLGLLTGVIATEVFVGLFLGTITKIFVDTLMTAGDIISQLTGLGAAQIFNPSLGQQSGVYSTLIYTTGILMIFVTDTHHLFLGGIVKSYTVIDPMHLMPMGDFSDTVARLVSRSFALAVQLSAPFILMSFMLYLGMGLLARLVPGINVFFVSMPIQVALGLMILAITIPVMLLWFMNALQSDLHVFLP